jgi:hypothetical protein
MLHNSGSGNPLVCTFPWEILGSHGGEDLRVGLLGCNDVWTCG